MQARMKQCHLCPEGKLSILWRSNPPTCRYHAQVQTAKKQIAEKKKEGSVSKQEYNDFCRELWGERPHISDLSGKRLPEYDFHSPKFCNLIRFHMHHVKPIGKESKSKKELGIVLNKEKIIFVTYDEHQIIEYGSDKQKEEIGWTKFLENI